MHTHARHALAAALTLAFSLPAAADDGESTRLQEITVTGSKTNRPQSDTRISRSDLDKTAAQNMADIVKYLPLVSAPHAANGASTFYAGSGTSGYNIRGIDGNRIGLDVDGVDVPDATVAVWTGASMRNTAAGRDYIDPEMFQSVNVHSGITDASTDGLGGRVSFANKTPQQYLDEGKTVGGEWKTGYNSADKSWLAGGTVAAGGDRVKALLSLAHRNGHELRGNSHTAQFPANWHSNAVLGRVIWDINPQNRLGLTLDYYGKTNRISGMDNSVYSSITTAEGTQRQQIIRRQAAVDYTLLPENFALFDQLKAKAFYQNADNNILSGYPVAATARSAAYQRTMGNNYKQQTFGVKLDAEKTAGIHRISYGITADRKKYGSSRTETRRLADGTYLSTASLFQGSYLFDSTVNRYAAYVADEISLGQFTLTPALRGEHSDYKPESAAANATTYSGINRRKFNYLAPSVSLGYQITPASYVYAKYARGVRVPAATELGSYFQTSSTAFYYLAGNPNLKKESGDTFELGWRDSSLRGVKFELTGFYTKYKNFIDYRALPASSCSASGVLFCYQAQNLADAAVWGGELTAKLDLGAYSGSLKGFSSSLSLGKSHGKAKGSNGVKTGMNSVLPGKAVLTLAYDDPADRFGAAVSVTGVQRRTASADASTYQQTSTTGLLRGQVVNVAGSYTPVGGYGKVDLSAYYNFTRYAKLGVALNNVFDKRYWDYSSVGTLSHSTAADGNVSGSGNTAAVFDRAAAPGRNVSVNFTVKF